MLVSRRNFMGKLGASALSLLVSPASAAEDTKKDVLVCVFQRGAMDGLNAVVPYAEGRYYDLRPTLGIAAPGSGDGSAIDLDGQFGLHPAMAPLKAQYDVGNMAIVHAAGATQVDHSHFSAQRLMELGLNSQGEAPGGWLARYLNSQSIAGGIFQAISVANSTQKSLSGYPEALAMASAADFKLTSRYAAETSVLLSGLSAQQNTLGGQMASTLTALDTFGSLGVEDLPVDNGANYANNSFARAMKQAAQYIKADIGTEIICVDTGGWDHHNNLASRLNGKLTELSEGLAAFVQDMGARMANVTVITMTEFGRRAKENSSNGTDHGRGSCMFALGNNVNGGKVYTDWPGLAENQLRKGDLEITTDYRTVLGELVNKRMRGGPLDEIFPGYTMPAELGLFKA